MSFDWRSIEDEENAELAFYRLLGEMLQRKATSADLRRVREYLQTVDPGPDAWHSLGEALFHTTGGSSEGYQVWTDWARRVTGQFDESQQLAAWQRFRISSSDAFEADTDAEVYALDEPSTIQIDDLPPESELDDTTDTKTDPSPTHVVGPARDRSLASSETPELLSMVPCGPYTIRVFDDVWDDVDEFALLALLRRGLLLGIEILYGGRWVPIMKHPGFEALITRMRHEAQLVLSGAEPVRMERTQPGDV